MLANLMPLLAETAASADKPLTGKAWICLAIFAAVYVCLTTEIIERSLASLLGAVAVIVTGGLAIEDAWRCVDLNVLFLLIGMMTSVAVMAETGFIEWLAVYWAKRLKGDGVKIVMALLIINMLLSSILPNVTVVIMIVPVTVLIAQILELPMVPLIVFSAMASNIGGVATYIGDPPNAILGSYMGMGFMPFIYHMTPVTFFIAAFFLMCVYFSLRSRLKIPAHVQARILDSYPELAIRNRKKMNICISIFGLMLVALIAQTPFAEHFGINIPIGIIAILAMVMMILLCKEHSDKMYRSVEWDAIMYYIGLFIIIGSLDRNGVIEKLARMVMSIHISDAPQMQHLGICMIILFGAAILSAFLDNTPFIIAMCPLVKTVIGIPAGMAMNSPEAVAAINHPDAQALIWSLLLGTCLGGNGTLIGSSANIVAAKIAEKSGQKVTFGSFTKIGFPIMIGTVVVSAIYVYVRYFAMVDDHEAHKPIAVETVKADAAALTAAAEKK